MDNGAFGGEPDDFARLDVLSDIYKLYQSLREIGELNYPFDADHLKVLNAIDEKYGRQMGDLLDDDGNPCSTATKEAGQ
jgi:hypothetical protein